MKSLDTTGSEFSTTSGLATATQVIGGTAVPIAGADSNATAFNAPYFIEIVVPAPSQTRSLQSLRPTTAIERSWKRMAGVERKRATKRGLRGSDVDKVIETERYGK